MKYCVVFILVAVCECYIENCKKECPATVEPICAEVRYTPKRSISKTFYSLSLNRCQFDRINCEKGVKAVEVPISYCSHDNKTSLLAAVKVKKVPSRSKRSVSGEVTHAPITKKALQDRNRKINNQMNRIVKSLESAKQLREALSRNNRLTDKLYNKLLKKKIKYTKNEAGKVTLKPLVRSKKTKKRREKTKHAKNNSNEQRNRLAMKRAKRKLKPNLRQSENPNRDEEIHEQTENEEAVLEEPKKEEESGERMLRDPMYVDQNTDLSGGKLNEEVKEDNNGESNGYNDDNLDHKMKEEIDEDDGAIYDDENDRIIDQKMKEDTDGDIEQKLNGEVDEDEENDTDREIGQKMNEDINEDKDGGGPDEENEMDFKGDYTALKTDNLNRDEDKENNEADQDDDDAKKEVQNTEAVYDDHEEVNQTEYQADCPSVCPVRDVMVCARCGHNIYRTFPSVCHMRMFHCKHPDETLELVSRQPCTMSAPYLSDQRVPLGKVHEPQDEDPILRYIRCKSMVKLKPYMWRSC